MKKFILTAHGSGMNVGAGFGDCFRFDGARVVAPGMTNIGEDRGDIAVFKIVAPGRHGETPLLAFDGYGAGEAVENNMLDAVGAGSVHPFGTSEGRSLAFLTETVGLMAKLASLMKV